MNSDMVLGLTGIYYVNANIIFKEVSQPIALVVSVNGDTMRRRSLYAGKGNPNSVVESLTVSGPMFVQRGKL